MNFKAKQTMKKKLQLIPLLMLLLLGMNSCNLWEEEEEVEGDVRDRFLGSWTVTETSKLLGTRNYKVTIEKDASFPARVNMYNLYALGTDKDSVIANVSSVLVNTITIPNQTRNANYIGGQGEMVDEIKINFDFTVDDGNDIDTVTAVFVR